MNTPTLRQPQRRLGFPEARPIRMRPQPTAILMPRPPTLLAGTPAEHDFLVPNPRPDLSTDPATLRMIEVW